VSADASTALRIYIAGLSHETNSFSPLPTSLRNFESDVCYRPGDDTGRAAALAFPGYGDAVAVAREQGFTVIEGPCFCTQPSGPVPRVLYERLRDDVLEGLRAAGPVDMILLNLHGAMVAQQVHDCEGDLLAQVRRLVGPAMPVGALLDLHGNVSPQMVESGAIIVGVKEYPHVDYRARTVELVTILAAMVQDEVVPFTVWRSIPVLSLQGTTEEPMRSLVDDLLDYEQRDGILSVTLMHGFPWSDWERTGASVLVIAASEQSQTAAQAIAEEVAGRFVAILASSPPTRLNVAGSVDAALSTPPGHGPVVIADSSDNPGGGAACDSTFLLRELHGRGVERAVVGMIWDPQAARIAADAGVGARMDLRVGGKVGPLSGDPVDLLDAEVVAVRDDIRQRAFSEVPSDPLGLAVRLRVGGLEVVINSIRQQVFSPECFTELGIDLAAQDIVVVKSSQHFRTRFDPIARRTVYCNAPGSLSTMLVDLPYRRLQLISGSNVFRIDRPVERCSAPAVLNT
jgi:microcystin degradation protein MlrC